MNFFGCRLNLALLASAMQICAQDAVVLAYHRFGATPDSTTITPQVFEWQLQRLQQLKVPVVALASIVEHHKFDGRVAAITVDDGHESVFTVLYPIVKRYHVPVTLFVYPSAISNASYALTWDQLREMRKSGLVDVQSHTLWHPNFQHEKALRTDAEYERFVENQLSASRETLQKRLGAPVTILAWPFGIFDEYLERKAAAAGYVAAFTIQPHVLRSSDDWFRLPRFVISDTTRGQAFDNIIHSGSRGARVVDAVTKLPLADVTVTVGTDVKKTDKDGRFEAGAKGAPITLRAPGYRRLTATTDTTVIELTPLLAKALYLSTYGAGNAKLRSQALARLGDLGINALVIDIKGDRGLVGYPSIVTTAATVGAQQQITIPDLASFVSAQRAKGVYLIARIVVFKDTLLSHAKPQLAVKTTGGAIWRDREDLGWTDPFLFEARKYNIDLAVEAASMGFDEIQFDYVRFPDQKNLVFAKPSTEENRTRAIEEFLAEARQRLVPYNVFLSADVFGYVCWNMNDTGLGHMIERLMPLLDFISPMLYPSSFQFGIPGFRQPLENPYQIVRRSLERAKERTNTSPLRFRPWLQAFRDYAFDKREFEVREIREQIRAAEEFGSGGWMLWNPHNVYPKLATDR